MPRILLCFALILGIQGICRADDSPAKKKSDAAAAKYEVAHAKASDAFFKAMIAADKQAIQDLKVAMKIAKPEETPVISDALSAAEDALKDDQRILDSKAPLTMRESPWTDKMQKELNATSDKLSIGMTRSDCDAMEDRRGWNSVVVEDSTDGTTVEYSFVTPSSFVDKDLCRFKDGKLVRYRPTRLEDAMKTAPAGTAEQVGGLTSFGH